MEFLERGWNVSVPCYSNSLQWGGQRGWGQTICPGSLLVWAGRLLMLLWPAWCCLECCCDGAGHTQPGAQAGGHGPFPPLAGMCGYAEPQEWTLFSLPQWLCLGCHGLDFGLWMGCAALMVKNWVRWPGTQGEAPALKGILYSGFLFLSSSNLKSL